MRNTVGYSWLLWPLCYSTPPLQYYTSTLTSLRLNVLQGKFPRRHWHKGLAIVRNTLVALCCFTDTVLHINPWLLLVKCDASLQWFWNAPWQNYTSIWFLLLWCKSSVKNAPVLQYYSQFGKKWCKFTVILHTTRQHYTSIWLLLSVVQV